MVKLEFKKKNWYAESEDEKQKSLRAAAENILFETEKLSIANYRVDNLQRLKKLTEIASLPEKNSHHRYVTYNSFNAFSWLDFFGEKYASFDEVYITTYNFSDNAYIEQYSVDNSEKIFNFHKNWMDEYVFNPANIEKKRHWII